MRIGRLRTSFLDLRGTVRRGPKTSSSADRVGYHGKAAARQQSRFIRLDCKNHDAGFASVFTSKAVARSPLRRQVFHWCTQHQNLLPLHLSCTHSERKKRLLLSNGRGGGGSGVSSLSALPAGMFARNSSLAGNIQHRFASIAPDRGEWLGRRRNRRPCRAPGCRFAASSATVYPPLGRAAKVGGANASSALRQKTDR